MIELLGVGISDEGGAWLLHGVRSHARYTTRAELTRLERVQPDLGRPTATCGALIPIDKSPAHFDDLYRGYKIRLGPRDGSVQLRLEGIDAPELHYGRAAQPDGGSARDWLLNQVGFADVTYQPGTAITDAGVQALQKANPDAKIER